MALGVPAGDGNHGRPNAFCTIVESQPHQVSYTYPDLEPIDFDKFAPMIIQDGLFYLSGVDTLSPTMESSLIVSRNISKLLK